MIKNIYNSAAFVLMAILALTSCSPQDGDNHSLGAIDTITAEQVSFSTTVSPTSNNVVTYAVTTDTNAPYSVLWDFGNGTTSKNKTATVEYPFAGDYTVTLTMYTADGSATTKTQVVSFPESDFSLLNTSDYIALTGGFDNTEGKTWVYDRTVNGHFGIGPVDSETPSWWECPAEGKANSSLYKQEFNFKLDGVSLTWTNEGQIYTNEAGRAELAAKGYNKSSVPADGDFDVEYAPKPSYTFSINVTEKGKTLIMSEGAFVGHYTGTSVYSILSLTENELYLKVNSVVEPGNAWWYRFVPKK